MGILQTMISVAENDATTAALIDDRIFPLVYPSKVVFPCVTARIVSGYNERVISEQVNTTRIQFDVWSESYLLTSQVKSALMALFYFYSGTVSGQVIITAEVDLAFDTFEQNIKSHRAVIVVKVTHEGD